MPPIDVTLLLRKKQAEQLFIHAAFTRPDVALRECSWIKPEVFTDEYARRFWMAFIESQDPIKAATSVSYEYLADLAAGKYAEVDFFATGMSQFTDKLAQEQWMYAIGSRIAPLAQALQKGDLSEAQRLLAEMNTEKLRAVDQLPDAADIAIDFLASMESEAKTVMTGTKLDQALGGLWRGIEIVLCARPGVGKTALAFQIARNVAGRRGKVLFASLEMGQRELWARAVCGVTRIDYRDLIARRLNQSQRDRIIDTNNDLIEAYTGYLYIDDQPQGTADLWRKCDSMQPDLLIIDHLRLLSDAGENETQRLGKITWELKKIAREFDIAMLCLAQLNRKLEERQDKEPMLSDLRDSGQIEENADVVIGLHRDREYLDKPVEKSPARARVLKFRNGPSNQLIKWIFDGPGQWFEDAKI